MSLRALFTWWKNLWISRPHVIQTRVGQGSTVQLALHICRFHIHRFEEWKQYFHIPNCRFPIIFNWRLVESTMRRANCSTIFQCCHRILCSLSQWRSSVAQELMKNRHLFQWEFWYDAKIAKLARFVFLFLWITLLLSLFFHGHTPDHLFARCPGHLCCLSLAA